MSTWLGRQRASQDHPGLDQVDRLLAGGPDELEVSVVGLPGRLAELFSVYEDLFELRDYRVRTVDRRSDDLWVAQIERSGTRRRSAKRNGLHQMHTRRRR